MSCNIVQCAGLSIQEVIEDPASGIESSWWSAPGEEDVMITLDLDPSCSVSERFFIECFVLNAICEKLLTESDYQEGHGNLFFA